jgi:cytochrome P450
MQDELFTYHHRLLTPTAIGDLTSSYAKQISHLHASINLPPTTSLNNLIVPQMYDSSMLAFMGTTFPTTTSYPLFLAFDKTFPLLAAGFMPDFVTYSGRKLRSQLTDVIQQWLEERWNAEQGERDESACELVKKMVDDSRAAGYNDRDVAALLLTDLWALQANSTWACFWVVAFMLQQPHGLKPLYEELNAALETFKSSNTSTDSYLSTFLTTASLPLLTSTITETLRFTTSSASIRRVTQPEGASLAGYTFEKDDELICFTRTVHLNSDLYDEPLVFKPGRYKEYLTEEKDKGARFWNPFGGGVSMCEGRYALFGLEQESQLLTMHIDISLNMKFVSLWLLSSSTLISR